jgi:hypothetical protein
MGFSCQIRQIRTSSGVSLAFVSNTILYGIYGFDMEPMWEGFIATTTCGIYMAYDSFDYEIDKFRSFALGFLPLNWCFPFGSDLVSSCPSNVVLGHCGLSHGAVNPP